MNLSGRIAILGPLIASLLAGSALAQTSPQAAPVARSPDRAAEDAAIDNWINDTSSDQPMLVQSTPDLAPVSRRIHGEVGATIGSNGYRNAYGSVTVPFGEGSSVSVAGADEQWKSKRWGSGERRLIALGVYVDGSDIARLFDKHRRCNMREWAPTTLREDPVINEDGTCERKPQVR